jgi:Cu-Zn family superoxide dismutase
MKLNTALICTFAIGLAMQAAQAETAKAVLSGTKPGLLVIGTVMLQDAASGLKVDADITQAPAGIHAFHIHEFGLCSNEAKDAGSHYNPAGHPHGDMLKDGIAKTHAGDFGNIVIDANGKGALHTVVPGLTLTRNDASVAGRAFVLHEKADDFSQPVGNAGARIGCGPIVITGK